MNVCSGVEHLEEIAQEARIERDADVGAVVGDGQLDVRLAELGAVAGQHDLAVAEGEIDAAALLAGDDRRLAHGRVERADGQLDLQHPVAPRKHVAPLRIAAFDQPRVDRRPAAADQHVVLAGGELDVLLVVGQGPFEQLHGPGGDDRHVVARDVPADRLGRAFLPGQAAAVGGHGRQPVGRQAPAARRPRRSGCSRCRWRRPCGGSPRGRSGPASRGTSLPRRPTRWETRPGSPRAVGTRSAGRGPASCGRRFPGSSFSSELSREDRAEAVAGQDDAAGRLDREARHLDADAHLQVGAHQDGLLRRSASSLTFCRIGLGLRAGATLAAIWKACKQFVAFAGRFHGSVLPFFDLYLSSSISMAARNVGGLADGRRNLMAGLVLALACSRRFVVEKELIALLA